MHFSFEYGVTPVYCIKEEDTFYFFYFESYKLFSIRESLKKKYEYKNIWIAGNAVKPFEPYSTIILIDFIPIELSIEINNLITIFNSTFDETYPPDFRFKSHTDYTNFVINFNKIICRLSECFKENNIEFKCNIEMELEFLAGLNPNEPKMFDT